ncbi:B12-binding domain-containing radical SAM protein [Methylophaga thalassica]|uniref:B12-binding domain-containing radical SAM protein n=1 Tax=Methylophaga aminisulfidivorans TaxID=230105 RepID=UPI0024E241DE|nr:radical SAM protein [Methylophaga aminisulfidivorans]
MKVLFSNPPWYKEATPETPGWRGVRAGSRWPHTFQVHSHTVVDGIIQEHIGGYLPFPVWLATGAAYAKREGFETVIRDSLSMGETFDSFYQFIKESRPDFIVIESSTPTVKTDLKIVSRIKTLLPDVKVAFTGLHTEFEDETFLEQNPVIDFTIYGEYETTVIQLLCALRDDRSLEDIPALIYRDNGKIHRNEAEKESEQEVSETIEVSQVKKNEYGRLPDLSTMPWAEREGLPNLNYFDGVCGLERPQLQLMATRGCPYGCIFCAWPQMLFRSPRYRMRTTDDVIEEIKANLEKVPYKSIYIDDDTVNINKKFVLELAAKMKSSGIGNRIPWSTMGRADLMDRQTLEALKDAGLFSIKYGVESAEQGILDEIDKRMNAEKNIEMIKLTSELGIRVHLTFTFGLPSDTAETIENTIDMACGLPADTVQFSIATPFPGTEMYRLYDEKGWIVSKDWDDYNGSTVAVSRTENFTAKELEAYVKEAYRRFDQAQVERAFPAEEVTIKLKQTLSHLNKGDSVVVMQSSRVHLTRWIITSLAKLGLDVHVLTPVRFKDEFSPVLSEDKIHAFSGNSHFLCDMLKPELDVLRSDINFKGAFIPYTFENRDGYQEVESVASYLAGNITAGVSRRGQIFSYNS